MKAKSRRRLLISSVAMLLVAMLALGTATFAWFTSSTSATASGITVRTAKTSSLEISDSTRAYGNDFTYTGMQSIMLPASSIDGNHWFYTNADSKDSFASTTSGTAVTRDSSTSVWDAHYVYAEQLNIKNAAASTGDNAGVAVDDITITINNISNDYFRIAVVPVGSKAAGLDVPSGTDFKGFVIDNGSDNSTTAGTKTYYPLAADGALQTATTITPKTATSGTYVIDKNTTGFSALASLNPQAELHYNIYVWFEGQDSQCYDGSAGQGVTNVSLAVTGTPHSEI